MPACRYGIRRNTPEYSERAAAGVLAGCDGRPPAGSGDLPSGGQFRPLDRFSRHNWALGTSNTNVSGTIELERRREAYQAAFRRWSSGLERRRAAGEAGGEDAPEALEARRAYRDSRDRLAEYLLKNGEEQDVKRAGQPARC